MTDTSKLSALSTDFDTNMARLKNLIEKDSLELLNEAGIVRSDCHDSMMKLTEAVDRVEREVQNLKRCLFDRGEGVGIKCSDFRDRLQRILNNSTAKIASSTEIDSSSLIELSISSSPISLSRKIVNETGDSSLTEEGDFPTTPTLDQLGLSGRTLSIVGRFGCGSSCFDSGSTTVSDSEFETSFYQNQKSPTVRNNFDNSFSSDVSVPNFNILNSSPLSACKNNHHNSKKKKHKISKGSTPSILVNVTCNQSFEQDDTENSFNSGNDSSFIELQQCEGGNLKKSVHFALDMEKEKEKEKDKEAEGQLSH